VPDAAARSEFLSIVGVEAESKAATWSEMLEELAAADLSAELAREDSSVELWDGIAELPRVIEAGTSSIGRPVENVVLAAARADGELAQRDVRLLVLSGGRTDFYLIAVPSAQVRRVIELAQGFGGSARLISQADVDAAARPVVSGYVTAPAAPGTSAPGVYTPPGAAPGFVPAPGYTAGTMSYALGFLAYIPIPFAGLIIAGIAMAASKGSVSRRGPVAAENARRAANWGLTVITVVLLTVILLIISGTIAAATDARGFFPTGLPILLYFAVAVAHLVVLIAGLVSTSSGRVFTNPIAIPFFRAAR